MRPLSPSRIALALALALTMTSLAVAGATAGPAGRTTPAKPVVVAGFKNGPVDVPGSNAPGPIASLKLPKGAWSIWAKGFLRNETFSETTELTTCSLVAGHDSDRVQAAPFNSGEANSTVSFQLNVIHVFAASGPATLKCASAGATGDVTANLIRITAIQAGQLTNGQLGGPSQTTGSGIPRIISGSAAGPTAVSGNNTLGTVASLKLPSGAWFVTAKAYLQNTGGSSTRVLCRLLAGSDADQTEIGLQAAGTVADREPIGMEVAHVFSSSGPAALRCSSGNPSGVEAHVVRITAVKAGQLTTQAMGSPPVTTGSGIPQIVSVHRNAAFNVKGENKFSGVASFKLGAGKWAFFATAYLDDISFPNTTVQCELLAGTDHDDAHLILTISTVVGSRDGFELQMTHVFAEPGTVTMQCKDSAETGQVQIQFVEITAVKAGTLTNVGL